MYRKLILLALLISIIIIASNNVKFERLDTSKQIQVEVKGEVINEKLLFVSLGSKLSDILDEIELTDSSDINSLSLNETLYNNEIIVIPAKKEYSLISINSATLEQLILLPGIGESIAQKIIDYRENYGSFTSLDELMNVNGIGQKKYEKIKEYITL